VIEVLKVLHRHGVPFVARGAGTGLASGALAEQHAVLLVLTRLNHIKRIDARNRRAVVEPGVVNAKLTEATVKVGLYYAPDPSSQSACTLGGNVAENSGGPHCLKYGVTTNHVVELEVVRADGSVIRLGSPQGEPWGPDLVALFVGSEGMFGVATEITLRLEPIPLETRTLLAAFASIRDASEAVSAIIASGIVPAALEMLDGPCVRAVEDSIYAAGYPRDAAAVLLVDLDGRPVAVEAEERVVTGILQAHRATELRRAATATERARLWQGRKKAFGAMGRLTKDLIVGDAVVPRSALPDILDRVAEIARRYDVMIVNVFHAGDGNLHPNLCYDRSDEALAERVFAASREIIEACVAAGGSISGEHGIGIDKMEFMPLIFDQATLDLMCDVRGVFDPSGRSNPGKVIPVRACREWRAGGFE
jgi:glycolate oxidase subunit GlcD